MAETMNTQLRLKPVICRRKSDNSLWTPAGDCPYPFSGFNFVRVLGTTSRRWWKAFTKVDMDDRWVLYDGSEFDVVEGGSVPPVRMPQEQP